MLLLSVAIFFSGSYICQCRWLSLHFYCSDCSKWLPDLWLLCWICSSLYPKFAYAIHL